MRRRCFLTAVGVGALTGGCANLPGTGDGTGFTYEHAAPIAAVALGSDTVYLGSEDPGTPGRIVALDATTGDRQWDRATRHPGYALDLSVAGATLLIWNAVELTLAGLEGFADDPWTRSGIESFPPPTQDGTAYLHREQGIEAVAVADGDREWHRSFQSDGGVPKPELVVDDVLVAATWSGRLTGLSTDAGDPHWWEFTRNIGPQLMVHQDAVLVGGEYRTGPVRLDRIDPSTGRLRTVQTFDTRHVTPLHTGTVLIVQTSGAGDSAIRRLDPDTGEAVWTRKGVTAYPDSVDETLVVGYNDDDREVHAFETTSGARRWTVSPPNPEATVGLVTTAEWVYTLDRSTVTIWDRQTGTQAQRVEFPGDAVGNRLLLPTPDGAYVVIGSTLYFLVP